MPLDAKRFRGETTDWVAVQYFLDTAPVTAWAYTLDELAVKFNIPVNVLAPMIANMIRQHTVQCRVLNGVPYFASARSVA